MKGFGGLILGFVAIAGLAPAFAANRGSESLAQTEIKRSTQEFVEGFNSGDVDRMMKLYAPDYIDVNLPKAHQTWSERREYYRKMVADRRTRVAVTPIEIRIMGEYAFVWGTIDLTNEGPKPQQLKLRYMEVWKHFRQGWRSISGMDADLYPDSR